MIESLSENFYWLIESLDKKNHWMSANANKKKTKKGKSNIITLSAISSHFRYKRQAPKLLQAIPNGI